MSDGKKQSSIRLLDPLKDRDSKISLLKIDDNAATVNNSQDGSLNKSKSKGILSQDINNTSYERPTSVQ